jgi:hypothetical protein
MNLQILIKKITHKKGQEKDFWDYIKISSMELTIIGQVLPYTTSISISQNSWPPSIFYDEGSAKTILFCM